LPEQASGRAEQSEAISLRPSHRKSLRSLTWDFFYNLRLADPNPRFCKAKRRGVRCSAAKFWKSLLLPEQASGRAEQSEAISLRPRIFF